MPAYPRYLAVSAAIALLAGGCAGNGDGLDANGRPLVSGGGTGSIPLTATFESIQANVFTPICSVCHAGGGAPQGLRLDAANSYGLLVGVPSTEVPTILRVQPSDPDNSYLVQKLEGHATVGAQMPLGGPYLPADVIAVIRQWITDGAQPAASAVAGAFAVATTVPSPDDTLVDAPPQIMIGFNRDLDATRVYASSARIERLSGGGISASAVATRVAVTDVNPRTLTLWPAQALSPGRYRVLLRVAGTLGLTDRNGRALDGTSANGAGDTLVTYFDVEGKAW